MSLPLSYNSSMKMAFTRVHRGFKRLDTPLKISPQRPPTPSVWRRWIMWVTSGRTVRCLPSRQWRTRLPLSSRRLPRPPVDTARAFRFVRRRPTLEGLRPSRCNMGQTLRPLPIWTPRPLTPHTPHKATAIPWIYPHTPRECFICVPLRPTLPAIPVSWAVKPPLWNISSTAPHPNPRQTLQ